MDSRYLAAKRLWISAIVFQCVAFCCAFTDMVMSFMDYDWYTDYYRHRYYYSHPESGIMPLIGTVLILCAIFFISFALKKKKSYAIAIFVLNPCVILLLLLNIFIIYGNLAWVGYVIGISSSCLLFINIWLAVAFLAVMPGKSDFNRAPRNNANRESDWAYDLRELKNLLDSHVISYQEFEQGKKNILARSGMGQGTTYSSYQNTAPSYGIDGEYCSRSSRILIRNNSYSIVSDGIIISKGRAVSGSNGYVSLVENSGRSSTYRFSGNTLISSQGEVFRKR